ncbi:SIS domain-containing protein [Pseudothermotoga sp.]|uniref:SIS domain-containing protein n=1 Tax=Pseudothermotoga sp. TaxID=2033661 RepID=UPI0031F5F1CA
MSMSIFAQDYVEQPRVVRELLDHAEEIRSKASFYKPKNVLILGMGASYYSGLYATVYASNFGLNCRCEELSEVLWYWDEKCFDFYDLFVFVSQSGETVELKKFLENWSKLKKKSILVTNNPNSSVAKFLGMDAVFLIHAGQERAMGSTKTFTNSIVTLLLIFSKWLDRKLDLAGIDEHLEYVLQLDLQNYIETANVSHQLILVGRGFTVPILRMAQLTLAEVARYNCSWYSGGGFRHGAMELLVSGAMTTLVHLRGKTERITEKMFRELCRFDKTWLITNVEMDAQRKISLKAGLSEEIAPIPCIVVFQRLANELAQKRGYPSGVGMIASKVTSEE